MKHLEQPVDRFSYRVLTNGDKVLMGVLVVFAVIASILLSSSTSASAAITYCIAVAFFCIFCLYSVWLYKHFFPNTFQKKPRSLFLVAVISSLFLGIMGEIGTLAGSPISSPTDIESWDISRLILLFNISFVCITVALFLFSNKRRIIESRRKISIICRSFASLTTTIILLVTATALFTGVYRWHDNAVTERLLFLLACIIIGVILLLFLRNELTKRIECIFLIVALLCGLFLSISMPQITGLSWDDQIHFDRSLGLSYLGHSEVGEDARLLATQPTKLFQSPEEGVAQLEDANERTQNGNGIAVVDGLFAPGSVQSLLSVSTIAYAPSAIGLWIGRLFDFPVTVTIIIGRSANLILYVLVMANAIRIIPCKKVLLCAIALFPTNIFLASNYSYDTWVTSFIALGIALFLRERSRTHSYLSLESCLTMLTVFTIGILPKAIYFPILGILFLMPKDKFKSDKLRETFYFAIIITGLLIITTFILPILFSPSTNIGDVRGGEGINSVGQIGFILSRPISYCGILLAFLLNYFAPISSNGYILNYAYLGSLDTALPWISTLPFLSLIITALLDNVTDSHPLMRPGKAETIWVLFISLVSVALAATSLYISFTPVGLETINGCQPRYLIPVILPILLTVNLSVVRNRQGSLSIFSIASMTSFSILCDLLFVVY